MQTNARRTIIAVLGLTCLALALSPIRCLAEDATGPDRSIVDKLLKAIEANDYSSLVADGDSAFKAAMTKPMLQSVSALFSPRMKKGYTCSYLGELKQQGCRVLLWKLAFNDGGDDTLVKLVMKNGKVAGFWLQ